MRKIFARIHLWISLPLGLIFSMLCCTGAILVFEDEITELVRAAQPQQVASVQPGDGAALPASAAAPSGHGDRLAFFTGVRQLHRWLMDPPPGKTASSAGRVIIGICALSMAVVLLSGLFLWMPRNAKALRNRLTVTTNKGFFRMCYDAHAALGFYALILLLLAALIGPTWSFSWYKDFVVDLFGGDPSIRRTLLELHTGSWGGLFSKILQFCAALVGTALPLTGYYMWWKRTHPKRKKS